MQTYLTISFKQFFLTNMLLLFPLLLFGFLFSIMKRGCNRNLRKIFGYNGTLVFDIIGVPIHELSHLLMCLLFGHQITKVSLYRPIKGRYDNILGFVKHKYNANSMFQTAGCFFIGIAPMIFGSFFIVWIMNLLFPTLLSNLNSFQNIDKLEISSLASTFGHNLYWIIASVFAPSNFSNPFYFLGIYVIVSIALHMTISKADFDNAVSGFALLEVIIFTFTFLCNALGLKANQIFNYVEQTSSILISVLLIAFVMFCIVYVISYFLSWLFHSIPI